MTNALNGNGRTHNVIPNDIDNTQEICDFIEEVIGKCAVNPGYVFALEVIGFLSSLKQEDRLVFETLRVSLKMGFWLAALDEVVANATNETEHEPGHAEILTGLADDIDLFHNAPRTIYADIDFSGHREARNVRSEEFAH